MPIVARLTTGCGAAVSAPRPVEDLDDAKRDAAHADDVRNTPAFTARSRWLGIPVAVLKLTRRVPEIYLQDRLVVQPHDGGLMVLAEYERLTQLADRFLFRVRLERHQDGLIQRVGDHRHPLVARPHPSTAGAAGVGSGSSS